jgi:hypothetical protein
MVRAGSATLKYWNVSFFPGLWIRIDSIRTRIQPFISIQIHNRLFCYKIKNNLLKSAVFTPFSWPRIPDPQSSWVLIKSGSTKSLNPDLQSHRIRIQCGSPTLHFPVSVTAWHRNNHGLCIIWLVHCVRLADYTCEMPVLAAICELQAWFPSLS